MTKLKQRISEAENCNRDKPATVISWEEFFMTMAQLSQERPGDFTRKAVKYFS